MGEVLTINPILAFPYRRPFEVKDQYNGPKRGTWFFRSKLTGKVVGPFHHEQAAMMAQQIEDSANGFL